MVCGKSKIDVPSRTTGRAGAVLVLDLPPAHPQRIGECIPQDHAKTLQVEGPIGPEGIQGSADDA